MRYFIISNKYYKDYMSEFYKNNIEKFREYYSVNRDRLILQGIQYYSKNKAKIRARQNIYFKQYYEKNKDKINAARKRVVVGKPKPNRITIAPPTRDHSLRVHF